MSNFTLVWHFLIFGVLPYVVIAVLVVGSLLPVSYTHLTLPTICSV